MKFSREGEGNGGNLSGTGVLILAYVHSLNCQLSVISQDYTAAHSVPEKLLRQLCHSTAYKLEAMKVGLVCIRLNLTDLAFL